MEFSKEFIENALDKHHRNLSAYWSSLTWDDNIATVTFILEDGTEEDVIVDGQGKVTVSDNLLNELKHID